MLTCCFWMVCSICIHMPYDGDLSFYCFHIATIFLFFLLLISSEMELFSTCRHSDSWLLCSEEWKKFDCSCNGVQGQENWAVSLYCSRYILQHAHCQDMKLWFNKFEFGYLSLNLYLLMSFVKNPIKFYISSEYWKLGTYAMS